MNRNATATRIVDALKSTVGDREAENIAKYYIDAVLDWPQESNRVEQDIVSLEQGVPVQQVTGVSFFYGYRFFVDEHVLLPRPETEELVYWIAQDYKSHISPLRILDIGSGSGCIILSLSQVLTTVDAVAIDISKEALNVTSINAKTFGLKVECLQVDILNDDLADHPPYDIIVSNPPYILRSEGERVQSSVHSHEPNVALYVEGEDPLQFYSRILEIGHTALNQGGKIYFETSDLFHEQLADLVKETGYKSEFRKDLQGNWRMLKVSKDVL